jgi:hypothetical protein
VSTGHTYAEDGTYTLMVTVTESGGSPGTRFASATVTVGEADASLTAVAPTTLSEGAMFSGPVAYLADPGSFDPASKFSATIDWGDGTTTPGTISGSSGSFTISGSHLYVDELPHGVIQVGVSEQEANSTLGPVQDQVSVTEADILTAYPLAFAASDGVPFSGTVATFSDTSSTTPASDFTATVNWGDGTSTSGTVSMSGGSLIVAGNHTFNSPPGGYPVSVQVNEDAPGTAAATAASTANVTAGKPSAATQGARAVSINGALVNGTINANGDPTSYSFQYGTTTEYGSSTRSSSLGSGNSGRAVSASLSGLTPGTTYHYRVIATNAQGTAVGADQTFRTTALLVSLKVRHDGRFVVVVNAPGPGTVDLVVMAGKNVFGHSRARAKHAGRLKLLVRPNRTGEQLLKHHRRHVTFRLTVTFAPHSGRTTSITVRPLHPPLGA